MVKKSDENVTKKNPAEFAIYERPDPLRVIQPKGCKYTLRWVSKKKLDNFGGVDPRGWIPLTREEFEQLGFKHTNYRGEFQVGVKGGNIETGDLILCKMPKEMANARNEYFNQIANRQVGSVKKKFQNDARRAGQESFGDISTSRD